MLIQFASEILCDSKEALGMDFLAGTGGSYTSTVGKMYLGTGIEFTKVIGNPVFRSRWETVLHHEQAWQIEEECTVSFGPITRAQVESIQQSPNIQTDAVFFYDPHAVIFADKLWHCIVLGINFRPTGSVDDSFVVDFTLGLLRDN